MGHDTTQERILELAADVGRLRRRLEPDSSCAHLAARIACHVESLDAMLRPSAGEIVAWTYPDDAATVEAVLEVTAAHCDRLRGLLGVKA